MFVNNVDQAKRSRPNARLAAAIAFCPEGAAEEAPDGSSMAGGSETAITVDSLFDSINPPVRRYDGFACSSASKPIPLCDDSRCGMMATSAAA